MTLNDLLDMFEEVQSQTGIPYAVNGCETSLQLPRQLGQGLIRHWHLRDGLNLYIQQHQLIEEITVESHNQYSMFGLCYCVSGHVTMLVDQSRSEMSIRPGSSLVVNMTEAASVGQLPAKQPICLIGVAIAPHLLQTLLQDEFDLFPVEFQRCFQTINSFFWQQSATTSAMTTALHQILHSPYQGATQRLYLESKILELIALQLHQLQEMKVASAQSGLRSDEVERIYQARNILIQNLLNPPSLLELARQVGLNDFKLKQGFHQVFGTTAFGCLHQYRMEQARQLLETQKAQVAIAAQAVGYNSLSSFHRAYKKYFGVNPGRHRNGNRS
jgi:AraC family transcriptional regulator, transcriptional activator of the genes for pyochelin and ferripyochelin receptors